MSRTFSRGKPRNLANVARLPCVPCEAVQIVARSALTSATAQEGPSEAWLCMGQKKLAASALAPSGRGEPGDPFVTRVSSATSGSDRRLAAKLDCSGKPDHSL